MTGCKTTGCLFRVSVRPKMKASRVFTYLRRYWAHRSCCEVVALPVGEADGVVASLVASHNKPPSVQEREFSVQKLASNCTLSSDSRTDKTRPTLRLADTLSCWKFDDLTRPLYSFRFSLLFYSTSKPNQHHQSQVCFSSPISPIGDLSPASAASTSDVFFVRLSGALHNRPSIQGQSPSLKAAEDASPARHAPLIQSLRLLAQERTLHHHLHYPLSFV
jgi:hypothetical protein